MSRGTNGNQQGNMAQPGAEVDQNIARCERSLADQREDKSRRRGLIKHHFRLFLGLPVFGLFKLKNAADQLVQVVISHSPRELVALFGRRIDPSKQSFGRSPRTNLRSNRFEEISIQSFQPGTERSHPRIEFALNKVARLENIRKALIQAVERLNPLAKTIRLKKRRIALQLLDKSMALIDNGNFPSFSVRLQPDTPAQHVFDLRDQGNNTPPLN